MMGVGVDVEVSGARANQPGSYLSQAVDARARENRRVRLERSAQQVTTQKRGACSGKGPSFLGEKA